MKIAVICFTRNGYELMRKLNNSVHLQKGEMSDLEFLFFCKCSALKEKCKCSYVEQTVEEWAREQFQEKRALLFIGAIGIAVRAIASSAKNKLSDSSVIVMDDGGQYVIPILSGHVGGANKIAVLLAEAIGATAVITTATDVHHKFAVDLFAKENHLHIANKEGIAKVSAKVLEGRKIRITVPTKDNINWESYQKFQSRHPEEIEITFENKVTSNENIADVWIDGSNRIDSVLHLKPKEYIVGIGCKKGKSQEEIREFVIQCLQDIGITLEQVAYITSIDCKKEEEGIVRFAENRGILFRTFSSEELLAQEGEFHESEFVMHQVGVGNVCERAAMAACLGDGELVLPKRARDGITIAIAKQKWSIRFDEE